MLFWPLANIDYIINSFCNRDQFSEAICELITYQIHNRQKGVILFGVKKRGLKKGGLKGVKWGSFL